eukprot:8889-Heterococcus_DN1.PRE.1
MSVSYIELSNAEPVGFLVNRFMRHFEQALDVQVPARHSTFHVHVASLARASYGVALLLHGGGFTGVSWAPLVQHLAASCCCIAPDLRAHGLTTTSDDLDLSAETLVQDMAELLQAMLSPGG